MISDLQLNNADSTHSPLMILGEFFTQMSICLKPWGPIFEKSYDELMKNLWQSLTYEKQKTKSMWLSKNLTKILRKTYDEVMQNLWKTCDNITGTVSYENAKFAASDVSQETLCQRLLLVEYFELKTTNNQSDNFLTMLSKNDLPFS